MFPRIPISVLLLVVTAGVARADLHFPRPVIDAGDVHAGPLLRQVFDFVNQGPEAAVIWEVTASCGCLKPKWERKTYAAGERGRLLVEIHTLSERSGAHSWRVQVRYRVGTEEREQQLRLNAQLIAEIRVEPPVMTAHVKNRLSHLIRVTDCRPRPTLTIVGAQSSAPYVRLQEVTQAPVAEQRGQHRIEMTIAANCPTGQHEGLITLTTNDPVYRELQIPLTIVKRESTRLSVLPAEVTLRVPAGQAAPAQLLRVRDSENQPIRIERIEASDPRLVTRWAAGPGNQATVRVTCASPPATGARWTGFVHIHISAPAEETITVPVIYVPLTGASKGG
ncbi:MAG: DUF1573 domain-containing protein [Gemmataceae bacterium]